MTASRSPALPLPSIPLWLVWAVALAAALAGLGSYGLLNNNEGLYAEIPREMLASGDWRQWIIPHLNGLPYMEKPPLLYWLTALSFALFGISEWSARLVPACSALACVALLLWFGRHAGHARAARLAALMFSTGFGVFAMSRALMFDMLLTALLTAALMLAWRRVTENRPRLLRWAYAWLALALLAKGFVALILFGLVALAFDFAASRSVRDFIGGLGKWFEWRALAVFAAIALPWHLAASLVEPAFAWFYFINEHVLRFLGRREPHDYYGGAWWYYLPRMLLYLFPWSLLLPCLLARRQQAADGDSLLSRFLLLAWLLPLAFFSISSAKANYYLVAVMPFAALHLALAVERRGDLA
ncbi:MAG: phospholipid carrier-dependent glycosyltransferase, partial [Burkholderiaceae bacterium]